MNWQKMKQDNILTAATVAIDGCATAITMRTICYVSSALLTVTNRRVKMDPYKPFLLQRNSFIEHTSYLKSVNNTVAT